MPERPSLLEAACWCCGEPAPIRGEGDPWEGRMDGYCRECATTRCDTTDSTCSRKPVAEPSKATEAEFLAQLERLGNDWRYSDEYIGIVVRARFPRDYRV